MADKAIITLIVLYEEELRKAARLLAQAFDLPKEAPDADVSRALHSALQACRVALYHPGLLDDTAIVMLTTEAARGIAKKRRRKA